MIDVPAPLLTIREAAARFGVSPATVLRWIRNGDLEHVRLPSGRCRVPLSAVEAG